MGEEVRDLDRSWRVFNLLVRSNCSNWRASSEASTAEPEPAGRRDLSVIFGDGRWAMVLGRLKMGWKMRAGSQPDDCQRPPQASRTVFQSVSFFFFFFFRFILLDAAVEVVEGRRKRAW